MKVFVDTSAWISLVAKRDPHHTLMAREWSALLCTGVQPVTTGDVIAETITRLRYYAGHAVAVQFYQLVREALCSKRLLIRWADAALFEQAWKIFLDYEDQDFSMVDCLSFALCRGEGIEKAFTLDCHFRVAGLQVIPGRT